MGMPKRITQSRWVISRKDPSLSYFTNSQLKDYWMTLDIEKLEPLEKALDAPVQFKIAPLEVRFEWMDEGPKTNWWNVFQTHVREIRGLDWKPVWSKPEGESVECLDDAERENFPLDFVQDVASMIIELAKGDGKTIPFLPPVGFLQDIGRFRLHRASREATAPMVGDVDPSA
ncbi:MAG: hypothetical protein ACYTEQ_24910 [Planctomycetota bacterium]|jgi:hypothetical protein